MCRFKMLSYGSLLIAMTCSAGGTFAQAAEKWQDHKIFPYSIRKTETQTEEKSWLPRIDLTRNHAKPVTDGIGRSWETVQKSTNQVTKTVWSGTKRILTPAKNVLPNVKAPKLRVPKLSWPSWGSSAPETDNRPPASVGDWLRNPRVGR